ncbi:MAG: non-ribosomal peptide synthetase [Hyphomicrobiales bacterium]|nr:non-ribosomal peptide synthetase [Hyphomicrobiales bacterium]
MLGAQQISIHDDFFELGGQSLIALRLFNRIRKQYGVELPLSMVFQAPTIATTAAMLREILGIGEDAAVADGKATPPLSANIDRPPAARPSTSANVLTLKSKYQPAVQPSPVSARFQSLVEIKKGGDRPGLFCVHGAGGNVLNFRDLSWGLHPDQPFFALQARGIDGISRPHRSIEEMAEAYLEEIRAQQPRGPYFLAGYSGGGIVAFEMARRLTALGEQVPLLVFLDTFHPQMPTRAVPIARIVQRLRDERVSYLRQIARDRIGRLRDWSASRRIERCLQHNKPVPIELRDRQLTEAFAQAAARYRPQTWQGRAILYRAERVHYVFSGGGPCYGWDKVVLGGVETSMIPGDHDTLLLGPNARELLSSLNAALDDACKQCRSRRLSGVPAMG